MSRSREGYLWTKSGITTGLPTKAVISSTANIKPSYDVIIVGAGFTGLRAARELVRHYGLSVLIVEGRDRIGGRTWTAQAFGEDFEMGGTWVRDLLLNLNTAESKMPRSIGINHTSTPSCTDTIFIKISSRRPVPSER